MWMEGEILSRSNVSLSITVCHSWYQQPTNTAAGVDLMVELSSSCWQSCRACSSSALLCWLAAPFLREISETDLASRRAAAVGGESQYRTVRRHTCFGDMTEPNGYMASSQSRTFFSNVFAFIGSHDTNVYINIKQKAKPIEKIKYAPWSFIRWTCQQCPESRGSGEHADKKHCQRHYGPRRWLLWPVNLVW